MEHLFAGTDDPDADQAVRNVAAHVASVIVDHDREPRTLLPGRPERITMVVAAKHQVDPGFVEHRHEEFIQVDAPVPGPGRRQGCGAGRCSAEAVRNSSERTAFFNHSHSSVR